MSDEDELEPPPDERPGTYAGVVELSVTVAAPPEDVWRALTEPDRTARWMGGFRMTSAWEVGAPFAIVGVLHGKEYAETGIVLAVEPGRLLKYDQWSRLWRVPDTPENRAVMTIRLDPDEAESGGTRVSLRHELPDVVEIVPHSRFFWTVSLELLKKEVGG